VRQSRLKSAGPGKRPDTCRHVVTLLSDYIDGILSAAGMARLERHLEGCTACARFLDSLKSTRAAVARLRCDQIPSEVHERLRAFLRVAGGAA
jgi:anti-sigma factor RsiW